jgi:hypothetical protein
VCGRLAKKAGSFLYSQARGVAAARPRAVHYPQQDLVAFSAMVQKELTKMSERAGKHARFQLDKIARFVRQWHKP